MVRVLSPMRIARVRRTSVQAATETDEIDFALGLNQGIQVFAVEFGLFTPVVLGGDPANNETVTLSLHAETGGLEGGISSFPSDNFILNSEILAEAVYWTRAYDNATQASYPSGTWLTPTAWDFKSILGEPLLFAQNLTYRVIASTNMTVAGAQATVFYKYVELTNAELGAQFALRR